MPHIAPRTIFFEQCLGGLSTHSCIYSGIFQLEAGPAVPVDRGGGGGGGGQEVAAGGGDGCCAPVSASGHQKSEQKLD